MTTLAGFTRCTFHCTECTAPDGHRLTRQTHIPDSTGASGPDGHPGQISVIWGTEGPEFKSRQPDQQIPSLNRRFAVSGVSRRTAEARSGREQAAIPAATGVAAPSRCLRDMERTHNGPVVTGHKYGVCMEPHQIELPSPMGQAIGLSEGSTIQWVNLGTHPVFQRWRSATRADPVGRTYVSHQFTYRTWTEPRRS